MKYQNFLIWFTLLDDCTAHTANIHNFRDGNVAYKLFTLLSNFIQFRSNLKMMHSITLYIFHTIYDCSLLRIILITEI